MVASREELKQLFAEVKKEGLTPEQEESILREIKGPLEHHLGKVDLNSSNSQGDFYSTKYVPGFHLPPPYISPNVSLATIDDLLKRDEQREKDGFPKKLKIGQIVQPTKDGKKVIVVPVVTEEKFYHDPNVDEDDDDEGEDGGSGEGEEGDVIAEESLRPDQGGDPGQGGDESGEHDLESNAYNLGKTLSKRYKLPHLKDKGKKTVLTKVKYDLTDRNRGSGQLLDKKASLIEIVKTNRALKRIEDPDNIDLTKLVVNPNDLIYRLLSLEKVFESQALVILLRDYSGSMNGRPAEIVVNQHYIIYSWLKYEYNKLVKPRFFVHETNAKEVPDFNTYYNLTVAGGTKIASGFKLVNDIVEDENLARDFNIYVFYGTDGDDWGGGDTEKNTIAEMEKMLGYVNRLGITVVRNPWGGSSETVFEQYIDKAGLKSSYPQEFRMDVMEIDADDDRIMEGIKTIIDP